MGGCAERVSDNMNDDQSKRIRELEAIIAEFTRRVMGQCEETKDVANGKYGTSPQGRGMEYWLGRRDVVFELAAFMHDSSYSLGKGYVHVSDLCGICKMNVEQLNARWPEIINDLPGG